LKRISEYISRFGSYARTEENKKSDIDILVNFSKESKATLFKYIRIINDLHALTGKKIDLVEDGQLKLLLKKAWNVIKY